MIDLFLEFRLFSRYAVAKGDSAAFQHVQVDKMLNFRHTNHSVVTFNAFK